MKVLIELPDGWLDEKYIDNLAWISKTVKQEVHARLVDAVIEQADIPVIEINKDKLEKLVLEKVASVKANEVTIAWGSNE